MSHGLQIFNDGGEIVVDADAVGMHYVGTATYSTNVARTNNFFFYNRVWRRYTITLGSTAAVPLAAIRPMSNRHASIERVFRSAPGSATWFIDCFSADTSALGFNETGMTTTASLDVYVFSTGVTSASSYGLQLMNSAGVLSWDFSAKPLWVKQVLRFPQRTDRTTYRNGDSLAIDAGIADPIIFNARAHGKSNIAVGADGTHEDSEFVFSRGGDGSVTRVQLGTYRERGNREGDPYTPQPDWALPAATLFVADASIYT